MEAEKKKLKGVKEAIITGIIPIILNILLTYGFCNTLFLYTLHIPTLYLSFTMMYLIYVLITVLVKKTHIATYIISLVIFVLSIVNNVKFYYTASPIYPSDLFFLGNIGGITGIVKNDFLSHIDYVQMGILLALLIGACILSKLNSITISNIKVRVITGVSVIVVLFIMFVPINAKDQFILNSIYNVDERKDYEAITTDIQYYATYGVLGGIYGLELENRKIEPSNYNEEQVISTLEQANASAVEEKDLQKPNIIVMFQESYWDIEKIDEIEFDKDITENFRKLKETENGVNLLSASYGGMSSNIEFELLTGGNLAYFPTGYHPFAQLYRKNDSEAKPSIIKELKNNGYSSKVVFGRDYYLSESIYKKLGIDEYINAYSDMPDYEQKIKGTYISDEALVDEVIEALKNKSPDEKIFYMTATIQTHMPFDKDVYDGYDINVESTKLSEEDTGIILSYAQGVYDTNVQIQRLYEEIQKIEEPTIIVVLGDHLPYLYNIDGEDVLAKLSYFNTSDEKVDLLRKYSTEALVLSNYGTKIDFGSEYISPDMLLTNIINQMDIEISPYYKWLYNIRNILPAQNQYITLDTSGNIYYANEEMTDTMQKTKMLRENIQYYLFESN